MINIEFKPNKYELTITGHAGHGKKGEDIVCSAISILFYSLLKSLSQCHEMFEEKLDFEYKDGKGYVKCKPKVTFEANIALIFWTILNGFEAIAEIFEKNVELVVI